MYIYIHLYMYPRMYMYQCMYEHVCIYVRMYVCMYKCKVECSSVRPSVCQYVYACGCVHHHTNISSPQCVFFYSVIFSLQSTKPVEQIVKWYRRDKVFREKQFSNREGRRWYLEIVQQSRRSFRDSLALQEGESRILRQFRNIEGRRSYLERDSSTIQKRESHIQREIGQQQRRERVVYIERYEYFSSREGRRLHVGEIIQRYTKFVECREKWLSDTEARRSCAEIGQRFR